MSDTNSSALKLLLDTAEQLFAPAADPDLQESAEQGVWPAQLWREIEDNGLARALVGEEHEGVGLSLVEAFAVVRKAGTFALPLPLAETMIAGSLLASKDLDLPSGPIALGITPFSPVQSRRTASGLLLSGDTRRVPFGGAAESLVLVTERADAAEGGDLVVVPAEVASGAIGRRDVGIGGDPDADFRFQDTAVDEARRAPLSPSEVVAARALAALSRVNLSAGALDRLLDLCVTHANERVQFGRPIGRFQAVQQSIAQLAGEVAALSAAAPAAARAWQESSDEVAVAAAKVRAAAAGAMAAAIAHQVHAAIGFTSEHLLHRFTRRLWAWRDQYGDEGYWSERLGQAALDAGGSALWPRLLGET